MEVTQENDLQVTINNGLNAAITYAEYIKLVKTLVQAKTTTGNDKSETMVNYTLLNDRRMKRWDKTVKVSEEYKKRLEGFNKRVTWLVITESWCGDAAHVIPVLNKIAELNQNIDLKLVMRDSNNDLMNQFLTDGNRAIPKLIMIDNETKDVLGTYGPRPSAATTLVNAYKASYGKLTPEFKEELQRWYNTDKGQTTIDDILLLLGV